MKQSAIADQHTRHWTPFAMIEFKRTQAYTPRGPAVTLAWTNNQAFVFDKRFGLCRRDITPFPKEGVIFPSILKSS
jgi:hypothetical protein